MSVLAVSSGGSYVDLPDPSYMGYSTVPNELTKSDRNTLGNLIKERIAMKATITVEWKGLSAAQKNLITSATSGNTFSVQYFDVFDDTMKYATFYRGDDASVQGYGTFNGSRFQYYDVTLSLVEC